MYSSVRTCIYMFVYFLERQGLTLLGGAGRRCLAKGMDERQNGGKIGYKFLNTRAFILERYLFIILIFSNTDPFLDRVFFKKTKMIWSFAPPTRQFVVIL